MSHVILEKMITSYMQTRQPIHSFGWQGGEPTLMGLEFFTHAVNLQNSCRKPTTQIANGLQTNGTLIDDDWAVFLKRYRFLVGVSLDGPQYVHDHFRTYGTGKGTYDSVLKGIKTLQRHSVELNILTLVSQANISRALEVYQFLRDELGCLYHQYIECVEFDAHGDLLPFSINGGQWGDFLCTIFDEWLRHDTRRVSVRLFDSILATLVDGRPTLCSAGVDCRNYFVIEYNGDVYPCDFYVKKDLRLGNIVDTSWNRMLTSRLYESFGMQKQHWSSACENCHYLRFCAGDCQKNRPQHGIDPPSRSLLCNGWKQFFAHALPSFKKLAKKIKLDRYNSQRSSPPNKNIGRNEPCPCGSGKKYKKCCMK